MKKYIFRLLMTVCLFAAPAVAGAAFIALPTDNQTAQSVFEFGKAPVNFVTDIPSAGATARVQLPSNAVTACTIQSKAANTGAVFIGGSTVTNASGVNEGISINPGDAYGPISVVNSNLIYVATATAGNDVKVFCN